MRLISSSPYRLITPKMTKINLRSRRGADGSLGFFVALPAWWAMAGALLVMGFWLWSLAANMLGLTRGQQALLAGGDSEATRRDFIAVALGGYANEFQSVQSTDMGRANLTSLDTTIDVHAFPSPNTITVQARSLARVERFYPRPPDGGWE